MADYFRFNGVRVKDPEDYSVELATTSTSSSGRNQYLHMVNTPIGTVQSYSFKWRFLTPSEASTILSQVLNKSSFSVHYLDICTGTWKDGYFYASNFSAPVRRIVDGAEMWDNLQFSIVGRDPV